MIVLQAQALLVPKRESDAATKALEELEALLKNPGSADNARAGRRHAGQAEPDLQVLAKHATLVECGLLENIDDAARWIANRVALAHMKIDPAGARLLAERCGTDVKRLRNDVDRLLFTRSGRSRFRVTTFGRSSGQRRSRMTGR